MVMDPKAPALASWLCEAVPPTEFIGEELLMYRFSEYCVKLSIPLKADYLEVFLNLELKKILKTDRIKVVGTEEYSLDDPVGFNTCAEITTRVAVDYYHASSRCEISNDFIVDATQFAQRMYNKRFKELIANAYSQLQSTEDSALVNANLTDQLIALELMYGQGILSEFTDPTTDSARYKVCDTGLPAIDADMRGVYTKTLTGIEAPAGAGKTRMALACFVYRTLIQGKNVLFWALEQPEDEIKAMLVSHHAFNRFGIQVDDKAYLLNEYPTEVEDKLKTAAYELFDSGKFGKLVIREEDCYYESFISKLKSIDRLKGPFDLIVIDHMYLIESKPVEAYERKADATTIIKFGYKWLKRYARSSNKAILAINQLNREGIEASEKDQKITPTMAAGGIEVYRSTDYNLAITYTEEMEAQFKRRIQQPKKRSSSGFGSVICDVRLGICYWNQAVERSATV